MAKRIKYATNEQIIGYINYQLNIDLAPFVDKEHSDKRALIVDTYKLKNHQLRQIADICNGLVLLHRENRTVTLGNRGKWLNMGSYGTRKHFFTAEAK